jgi:hypothetical protein
VIGANVHEGRLLAHDAAQVAALAPVSTQDMHTQSMHAILQNLCVHIPESPLCVELMATCTLQQQSCSTLPAELGLQL